MPVSRIKLASSLRLAPLWLALLMLPATGARGQQRTQAPAGQAPPAQTQGATPAGQDQTPQNQTSQDQPDEVLRISTELVQTDVMVFDKQGRFVDNLKPEQFELKVDGKPQPLAFFERVAAGSFNEEAQLAAARGSSVPTVPRPGGVRPLDRGRAVIFFLDDLHMAPDSLERARKTLLRFIDAEMGQNDQAVITSASGRIGFLQQFTDNKSVLRAAVGRLRYQAYSVRDMERPPMTEYQALAVENGDQDALGYFIDQMIRDNPMMNRGMAENMVRGRARAILSQANNINTSLLSGLESTMRSAARLPGRKVVFFMSDGFFVDNRNSSTLERLRRITTQAARAGAVIYAVDSRGLTTGMPDASDPGGFDTTGRLARLNMGELSASQEPLYTLAAETGGRAIVNTNATDPQIRNVLKETAVYYLLVWRPDPAAQHGGKYRRLEVSINGRPDLTVRARRGFLNEETRTATTRENKDKSITARAAAPKTAEEELRAAISDAYARTQIPTMTSINYLDLPDKGIVLTVAMQFSAEALSYSIEGDKQAAQVDLAGVVLNDQGKQTVGFKEHLNVNTTLVDKKELSERNIFYNYQTPLAPGLYQVRVATRDAKSGHTGSDMRWVEIPDLSTHRLAMSSLFVGERRKEQEAAKAGVSAKTSTGANAAQDSIQQVAMSIDRRFARTSTLRFLTYIYNASRGPAGTTTPDVALQIQIFRDDQPVLTNTLRKLSTDGQTDLARIPYAAEVPLEGMPSGHYVLQITAIDRLVKASTSQRVDFTIE